MSSPPSPGHLHHNTTNVATSFLTQGQGISIISLVWTEYASVQAALDTGVPRARLREFRFETRVLVPYYRVYLWLDAPYVYIDIPSDYWLQAEPREIATPRPSPFPSSSHELFHWLRFLSWHLSWEPRNINIFLLRVKKVGR